MALDELDDLYHDVILDHCRNPRHRQELKNADLTGDAVNPFCGDEIHLQISLDEDRRVTRIGLQGEGCCINQASGSILTGIIEGKNLDEIHAVSALFNTLMLGDPPSDDSLEELHDLLALAGVRRFPVRIKCALLAWSALEEGVENFQREIS